MRQGEPVSVGGADAVNVLATSRVEERFMLLVNDDEQTFNRVDNIAYESGSSALPLFKGDTCGFIE